ncbi:hypothetical protein FGG08_003233 [Glutinoglossum americanum]|uniref:NB-ARC domain-containing protein n=1 Tax=Glutinoglossum americanum TaxID=1670608 RepID=A0A9P8L3S7_9PEZI|nr:hypothetical protein FGG08_003233 [Glutinoglossum americanum]
MNIFRRTPRPAEVPATEEPIEVNRYGISEVYCSETTPEVDIVFVHGLNGHPFNTWTGRKTKTFWPMQLLPKDLLKREGSVRILVYGYNADVYAFGGGSNKTSSDKIHNHAQTLVQTLCANRALENATERPIVFVCHSLGGIVVKRALQYSKSITEMKIEHLRSIYVSTCGILFLGTPHTGADPAKWGETLHNIGSVTLLSGVIKTEPALIKALQTNAETLQNINLEFMTFQKRYNMFFFHETLKMRIGIMEKYVVDEPSAAPIVDGAEYAGIEASHTDMCKFDSKNTPGYFLVAEAIQRYANKDALAQVRTRWLDDKKWLQAARIAQVNEMVRSACEPHQPRVFPGALADMIANENEPNARQPSPHIGAQQHQQQQHQLIAQEPHNQPVDHPTLATEHPPLKDPNPDDPLFVVPPDFSPNSLFVGMETELKELNKLLFDVNKRAEGTACVLLWCLAGGGKTHLARQYVYTEKHRFRGGVFWVTAKSLEELIDGFWHIAQKAALKGLRDPRGYTSQHEIDAFIEPVKDWFESREEWLLVFDGISIEDDSDLVDLRRFIPNRQNSSIIYTSVDRTLARKHLLLNPVALKVEQLKALDAQDLLLKELAPTRLEQADKSNAIELVQKMQYLPLMIHAAARYMRTTGLPLKLYLKSYSKGKMEVLQPYQRIFETLTNEYVEAANLINILCFFGQHIPVEMLQLGIRVMDQSTYPVKMREQGHEDLNKTIGVLIKFALVDRNDPDDSECSSPNHQEHNQHDTLKIHSVVQDFACGFLQDSKYKWLNRAIKVFCYSYSEADSRIRGKKGIGRVSDYHQYKIHGLRLSKHIHRSEKEHRELDSARFELEKTMASIKSEIQRRTPSSSQDLICRSDGEPFQVSIFDRSSSASSMGPETPSRGVSTASTWGLEIDKMESPTGIVLGLPPHPEIRYGSSPRLSQFQMDDGGYMSDRDEPGRSHNTTPTVTQTTPRLGATSGQDDGWQLVTGGRAKAGGSNGGRPVPHRTISERNQRRYRDRLGAWRNIAPTAVVDPRVHKAIAQGSLSTRPAVAKIGSVTGNSAAQIALSMAFQSASPPGSSHGGRTIGQKQSSDHSTASATIHGTNAKPTSYAEAVVGAALSDMRRGLSDTGSTSTAMRRDQSGESTKGHNPQHTPPMGSSPPNHLLTQSAPPLSAGLPLPPHSPSYRPSPIPSPGLRYANTVHRSDPTLQSLPGLGSYANGGYYVDSFGQLRPYGRNPLPLPYEQIAIPAKRPVPQDFRNHGRFDTQYPLYYSPSSPPHAHPHTPIAFGSDPNDVPMSGLLPTGYTSQPMSRHVSQQSADMTRSVADSEPARFPPMLSPPPHKLGLVPSGERDRHFDGSPVRKSPKYALAEPNSGNISPVNGPSDRAFADDNALAQVGKWAESPPSPPPALGEYGRHSSERNSGPGLGINIGGQIVQFGDAASVDVEAKSAQLRQQAEQQRFENGYYRQNLSPAYRNAPPYPYHNLMPRTTSDVASMPGLLDTRLRGVSAPGQPPLTPSFLPDFPDEGVEMRDSKSSGRRRTEDEAAQPAGR